ITSRLARAFRQRVCLALPRPSEARDGRGERTRTYLQRVPEGQGTPAARTNPPTQYFPRHQTAPIKEPATNDRLFFINETAKNYCCCIRFICSIASCIFAFMSSMFMSCGIMFFISGIFGIVCIVVPDGSSKYPLPLSLVSTDSNLTFLSWRSMPV